MENSAPAKTTSVDVLIEDWASDKDAFKNVSWGKAMMWIFLLSDTFIFSCFLVGYMSVRMTTADPWPTMVLVYERSNTNMPWAFKHRGLVLDQ